MKKAYIMNNGTKIHFDSNEPLFNRLCAIYVLLGIKEPKYRSNEHIEPIIKALSTNIISKYTSRLKNINLNLSYILDMVTPYFKYYDHAGKNIERYRSSMLRQLDIFESCIDECIEDIITLNQFKDLLSTYNSECEKAMSSIGSKLEYTNKSMEYVKINKKYNMKLILNIFDNTTSACIRSGVNEGVIVLPIIPQRFGYDYAISYNVVENFIKEIELPNMFINKHKRSNELELTFLVKTIPESLAEAILLRQMELNKLHVDKERYFILKKDKYMIKYFYDMLLTYETKNLSMDNFLKTHTLIENYLEECTILNEGNGKYFSDNKVLAEDDIPKGVNLGIAINKQKYWKIEPGWEKITHSDTPNCRVLKHKWLNNSRERKRVISYFIIVEKNIKQDEEITIDFNVLPEEVQAKLNNNINEFMLGKVNKSNNTPKDAIACIPTRGKYPIYLKEIDNYTGITIERDGSSKTINIEDDIKSGSIKYYINESTNSVNLYHLSDKNLDGKTLTPRIPDNYFTKNGYEDNTTKRVSFAKSIDGALMGIGKRMKGLKLYVHVPVGKYEIKNINKSQVPDCEITKEVWVTNNVKIKCIGVIEVIDDAGEDGIPFNYGDKTAELYKWNWKWVEKLNTLNESWVFNKKDLVLNIDKWKKKKNHNILFVTGLSGSGKTTLAEEYEKKYNAHMFEIDGIEHLYDSSNKNLLDKAFEQNPDCVKVRESGKWKEKGSFKYYDKILNSIIKIMANDPDTLYIIEGIQLFEFISIDHVKGKPMIIKGTSALNSILQRFKRNGGGKIDWIEELKNEFPQLVNWYLDSEKKLGKYKKSINESAHYIDKNIDDNPTAFSKKEFKENEIIGKVKNNSLTMLGEYLKISPKFNCIIEKKEDGYYLIANKPIKKHEELSINKMEMDTKLKEFNLIPSLETKQNVRDAISNFDKVPENCKHKLAENILIRARELNMGINVAAKWYTDYAELHSMNENLNYQDISLNPLSHKIITLQDVKSDIWLGADWHLIKFDKNTKKTYVREDAKNIIKYQTSHIKDNDIFIFLGDISDRRATYDEKVLKDMIKQIKGKIYFIRGNNDVHLDQFYLDCGVVEVCDALIYNNMIFTHRPIVNKYDINIHGHIHGARKYYDVPYHNHIDVYNKKKPCIKLKDIIKMYKNKEYTPIIESSIIKEEFYQPGGESYEERVKTLRKKSEDANIGNPPLQYLRNLLSYHGNARVPVNKEDRWYKRLLELDPEYIERSNKLWGVTESAEIVLNENMLLDAKKKVCINYIDICINQNKKALDKLNKKEGTSKDKIKLFFFDIFFTPLASSAHLKSYDRRLEDDILFTKYTIKKLEVLKDNMENDKTVKYHTLTKLLIDLIVHIPHVFNLDIKDKNRILKEIERSIKIHEKLLKLYKERASKLKDDSDNTDFIKKVLSIGGWVLCGPLPYIAYKLESKKTLNEEIESIELSLKMLKHQKEIYEKGVTESTTLWGEMLGNINNSIITESGDLLNITEAKKFPVQFDKDGNLLIKNPKKINFEEEFYKSHKLLEVYGKNNNHEGIVGELCKLWYMNNMLERKIYDKSTKDTDKKNHIKIRAKILNDFNKYLKLLHEIDSSFNFMKYYNDSDYNDAEIKISKHTLTGVKNIIKSVL